MRGIAGRVSFTVDVSSVTVLFIAIFDDAAERATTLAADVLTSFASLTHVVVITLHVWVAVPAPEHVEVEPFVAP